MINFSFELDPRLSAGQRTRQIVRERVGERLSDGHIYALLTVATELVNNAVQSGSGRRIDVQITLADDLSVRGMVDDHREGPRLRLREAPAPPSQSGLGMRMMDVHAGRWGVSEGSTGVWFEIGEDSRSGAPDGKFSGAELTEEPKPNRSPNDGSTDSGGGPRSRTLRRRRAGNGAGSSS